MAQRYIVSDNIMKNYLQNLTLLINCTFLLALTPITLHAFPAATLSGTFSKHGKSLSLVADITNPEPQCFLALFGSSKKSKLNESTPGGIPLTSISADSSQVTLNLTKLDRLQGDSRKKVYLTSLVSCVGEDQTAKSNIVTLLLPVQDSSSIESPKSWITQIKSKLLKPKIVLEDRFPALTFSEPVDLQSAPDDSPRLFVVEKAGRIKVFPNNASVTSTDTFLDITSKVDVDGERGLLGLAFHPDFASNGYFFLHYSKKTTGEIVIARYHVDSGTPNQADSASELVILEVAHPVSNHNAGQLAFGGDGFLYLGMGDGGGGGDPDENGQNLGVLLGKILRIDINSTSGSLNYAIPSGNPFAGNISGTREEIFAIGVRNPWRFSFDIPTERLWLADVGQSEFEEVDLVESGKNYGWNTMEAAHCYDPSSGCDQSGLTLPVAEYSHDVGSSITGGYVYRGANVKLLSGAYLFADFVTGKLFALRKDGLPQVQVNKLLETELNVSSFGVDSEGEHYLVSYSDGKLYRIGL